jgi:hypothetical protein
MCNLITTILIFTLEETLNLTFILCFIIMPKDQAPNLYEKIKQLYFFVVYISNKTKDSELKLGLE